MLFVLCLKRFRWLAYACLGGRLALRPSQPPLIASLCRLSSCRVRAPPPGVREHLSAWLPGDVRASHQTPCSFEMTQSPQIGREGPLVVIFFVDGALFVLSSSFWFCALSTVTNGTSHSPTAWMARRRPNGLSNGPSLLFLLVLWLINSCPQPAAPGSSASWKRFLTTLQFGNDISPEIGERVRTRAPGLVVSQLNAAQLGGREKVGRLKHRLRSAALLFHTGYCMQV